MHHVQDFIFTAGSVVFIIALVPSLRSATKPVVSTSLTTGSVLGIFAVCYASLSLWFSAIATAGTSLIWLTLAWQKYRQSPQS